jgi:Uma2 family endonuclease
VASPTRFSFHARQHGIAVLWAGAYAAAHPGVEVGDNATVFLDADNEVQPDVCLFYDPPRQMGGVRLTEDGYIEGAPPFVLEIASSRASYDLHDKMHAYRRAGVQEYVAWRVLDGAIDWFRLRQGAYERIEPAAHGVIEDVVFPGPRLAVDRMLAGDRAGVLAALRAPPGVRRPRGSLPRSRRCPRT